MERPSRRMRLTVVVEALAEENAHGEFRDLALAAFKERKFALPVQVDDTFETVWNDIEQRYKTNYLSPQQAATFSIKKLQDAYDCDLDMTDTVGDIFDGETDRKMHMIRVVPHFVYRETSVVPGSMLRPTATQKRMRDDLDDGATKRRRVESQQRQSTFEARDLSPKRPVPSVEGRHHAISVGLEDTEVRQRSLRSKSGNSLVELGRIETGQAPFSSTLIKQEWPEPEHTEGIDAATDNRPRDQQPTRSQSRTSLEQSQEASLPPVENQVPDADSDMPVDEHAAVQEQAGLSPLDSQDAAILHSPLSSAEPGPVAAHATRQRKDIYQVSSSPEFMHKKATPDKPARTYGRSPRSGAGLLNTARSFGRPAEESTTHSNGIQASITEKARPFQRPLSDAIGSTPRGEPPTTAQKESNALNANDDDDDPDLTASFLDEAATATPKDAQTPARKPGAKHAKPGSLKKPSRASFMTTPVSKMRAAQSKAAVTPSSAASVNRSRAKSKATTPSSVTSSKANGKRSIANIEDLLSASQSFNKRPGSATSPARSGSVKSQQSSRSSPEVRIPAKKATAVQSTVQRTSMNSPAPLNLSTKKQTSVITATPQRAVKSSNPKKAETFMKPATKVRESPAPTPAAKTVSSVTITPRRSEVPFPPNVRHLRRSSSVQSSPLTNGNPAASESSPATAVTVPAPRSTTLSSATPAAAKPKGNAIEVSSAESSSSESSSSESSDSEAEGDDEDVERTGTGMDVALEEQTPLAEQVPLHDTSNREGDGVTERVQSKDSHEQEDLATHITETQSQTKPPSGQEANGAAPWTAQSWSFGGLDQPDDTNAQSKLAPQREPQVVAVVPVSEDGAGAEQDIYSTAVEDNVSRSRSASAAASTRSSPAVSRRPARFLSHSPTPDASESDDDADEAIAGRAASPQANDKDRSDSESESDSSSDSSDDEDVELPDLAVLPTPKTDAKTVPPSSPPLDSPAYSTPIVPESSQPNPSQIHPSAQRTSIPPPTQQSSQVPRSSQSVSVQAADRRRYTGFRSLREQLADTKAAQAAPQKKTFDPRSMSLAKLAKGKPLADLAGNNESSDESSSSSNIDSD